jgi:hypothetical protein
MNKFYVIKNCCNAYVFGYMGALQEASFTRDHKDVKRFKTFEKAQDFCDKCYDDDLEIYEVEYNGGTWIEKEV